MKGGREKYVRRHRQRENITLEEPEAKSLFRRNKAETERKGEEKESAYRTGSKQRRRGVPVAEQEQHDQTESGRIIYLFQYPVKFSYIEMDKKNAHPHAEIEHQKKNAHAKAGNDKRMFLQSRAKGRLQGEDCRHAYRERGEKYPDSVEYYRDLVFLGKGLKRGALAHT